MRERAQRCHFAVKLHPEIASSSPPLARYQQELGVLQCPFVFLFVNSRKKDICSSKNLTRTELLRATLSHPVHVGRYGHKANPLPMLQKISKKFGHCYNGCSPNRGSFLQDEDELNRY